MDKMLYIAMSGAKQSMKALAINANNLANAKTTGFKADLAQARAMQVFGEGLPSRVFAMTEKSSQNFDSGGMLTTGRSLDIAIEGNGMIAVQAKDGSEGYTRDGHLSVTEEGYLQTSHGELILGDGGPITLPLPVNNIEITANGTIMVQPAGAPSTVQEQVARIKIVAPELRTLVRGNDGLFRGDAEDVEETDVTVRVHSGALESSNVNPVGEMTAMISLQRQFEMQLKLMKTAEENDSASASLLRAF